MLSPEAKSLSALLHEMWMEEAYKNYSGLVVGSLTEKAGQRGLILDLDSLPSKPLPFKEIFIRWLLKVNQPRIIAGEKPIITYELAMQCPLWKAIPPPFISVKLTKEAMFKKPKPTIRSIGSKPSMGSINSNMPKPSK
jgi:hypothetical protein